MHGRHSSAPRRLFVTVERNGHGIHCFVLFCPTSFPLHLVSHILYVCVYACVRACAHECVCPVDSSLRVCGACGHRSSSGKSGREGGGSGGGKGPRGGGGSVYEVGIMKRGFGGRGDAYFCLCFGWYEAATRAASPSSEAGFGKGRVLRSWPICGHESRDRTLIGFWALLPQWYNALLS